MIALHNSAPASRLHRRGYQGRWGARSGETITEAARPAAKALEGYLDPKPMVFCGIYPIDGDDLPDLRDSLDKLKLNDASFTYEPESPRPRLRIPLRILGALAHGDRARALRTRVRPGPHRDRALGCLPRVPDRRDRARRRHPTDLPDSSRIDHIDEPMLNISILTPAEYLGTVMDLCQARRGEMKKMDYLSTDRVELRYSIPLAEVTSTSLTPSRVAQGYASLDYDQSGYITSALVRVDLLINHEPVTLFQRSCTSPTPTTTAGAWRAFEGTDPAPDVRRAHPGGRRRSHHLARDRQGPAQDVLAKCYGGTSRGSASS